MNDMVASHVAHRITVDEYHRMSEAGVFPHDSRLELVEGGLIERIVPMNPPHAQAITLMYQRLFVAIGERAYVRAHVPITLGELSEPEPDITVVIAPPSLYYARHPSAAEIHLCIEVSDSSRRSDISRKVPLYATYGIRETWIVDLVDAKTFVYRDPQERTYRSSTIVPFDEALSPIAFPDIRINLGDVVT